MQWWRGRPSSCRERVLEARLVEQLAAEFADNEGSDEPDERPDPIKPAVRRAKRRARTGPRREIDAVVLALAHLPSVSFNKALGEIRLEGGGAVDFWSLDFTGRAARGRKYHLVLVDHLIDHRLVVVLRDQPALALGPLIRGSLAPSAGF